MSIEPVNSHRKREKGLLVYPVYSRRSGGLSVGINLFPERKCCSFDCPYCEVFPFETVYSFSLPLLETALSEALSDARKNRIKVEDICFSGNGEPTQSPFFGSALEAAFRIRDRETPLADVVLITNGTGLLMEETFDLLRRSALKGLKIWLKLDAGTENWYRAMNRSAIPYEQLIEKIKAFVKCAPVILQTMICAVDGKEPPIEERQAWEALLMDLASSAAELMGIQIYGKARPAPEDPLSEALPLSCLEERADSLETALNRTGKRIPVHIYP